MWKEVRVLLPSGEDYDILMEKRSEMNFMQPNTLLFHRPKTTSYKNQTVQTLIYNMSK